MCPQRKDQKSSDMGVFLTSHTKEVFEIWIASFFSLDMLYLDMLVY